MPGKVGVKIKAGRNLPVMDRGSDTTDAYVEIKLGNVTHKTDVCKKSLNPQWNSDWFRFEVDDAELQDEPLQIRLMDYDTYSANDAIGKVNISLNPLCLETSGQATHGKGTVLSGWIPVFDTMHGIRGEVNVIVKVDLFSDLNKFRQSSCGIPFFHSQCIPFGYRAQIIHGFVEELVVNDDPEYQWIDKIRTPRASNEARQVVFLKLSGQVQRKMGLKAINLGANAVIGYTQCLDLEGDVGVVARGIGTAVTLIKDTSTQPATIDNALIEERNQKYLEFLTGAGVGFSEQPEYKLEIQKSHSSTYFELKHSTESPENCSAEIMQDLIRQEDERGEKPIRKLKHHMRRFTSSSRNLFNEKCNAFRRKLGDNIDLKSTEHTSRSLINLFGSNLIKEEAMPPARGSLFNVHKQSFKTKKKISATKSIQRQSLKKTTSHPIVRSVSDDSAMKHSSKSADGSKKSAVPNFAAIAEFQESTRSSPNICSEEQQLGSLDSSIVTVGGAHNFFGEFSKHELHLPIQCNESATIKSCSSTSLSLSMSSSSSSEESKIDFPVLEAAALEEIKAVATAAALEEFKAVATAPAVDEIKAVATAGEEEIAATSDYDNVELAKVEKFLKMCSIDEDDKQTAKWIHPGQSDNLPESAPRNSLLQDLKNFSHHLQGFIHLPKMTHSTKATKTKAASVKNPRRSPPKTLSLKCLKPNEQKSYYSSQPEILIDSDADALALPATQISRSRSLTNLTKIATTIAFNQKATAFDDMFSVNDTARDPLAAVLFPQPWSQYPLLQICPSTPTPSESDNSQISPSDLKSISSFSPPPQSNIPVLQISHHIPDSSIAENTPSSTNDFVSELPSTSRTSNTLVVSGLETLVRSPSSPDFGTNSIHISKSHSGKHNKNRQKNILKDPFRNKTINTKHSNADSRLLAPSNSISLQCIHKHHNHRSLNEINATGCTAPVADSPCMKRFASPANAAIAASAATPTNANTAAGTDATVATHGNRSKQSSSPSRTGFTNATSAVNTQSQSDSLSSATTTTSTATTMITKETSEICRRSSDSDLSVTPKGNSICVASERLVAATALMRLSQPIPGKNATTDSLDMLEYPFLTMTKYPPGFILHLGATVAARSVKLLERVPNPDEPEVRDSWWTELRMEIRSHARALGCNVVLGYSECTTISDEVSVLSATGTAAVINMAYNRSVSQTDIVTMTRSAGVAGMSASLEERDILKEVRSETISKESMSSTSGTGQGVSNLSAKKGGLPPLNIIKTTCAICHIPYNLTSVPLNVKMKRCAICRKGRVPDVLLATLEVPEYLQITGRGCFMQAQVVRAKKDLRSELNAKEISDGLPFLEYELHRVLINKLKAKGMNAIFGLKEQVAIGERMIALIATGTALFLTALPMPQVPKIVAGNSWTDKQKLSELQKKLQETYDRNQEIYQLKCMDPDMVSMTGAPDKQSDTDESDDEIVEIDLNCGNKDTCVLEVDDIEDLEIISLLMEPYPPEGFHVVNTQMVPGMVDMEAVKNLQMFTQVWRAKLDVGQNVSGFPKHFQRLLQTIYFKLRTMIPCAICDLTFRLDLPESDQIQLLVTGMALGLADANKFKYRRKTTTANGVNQANANASANQAAEINGTHGNKRTLQEEDYIFPLDDDHMVETPTPTTNMPPYGMHSLKLRKTSPSRTTSKLNAAMRNRHFPFRDRYGVDITPLSFIPGGKIEKYLGNLNFFFIRESTSIRENGGISGFVHGFITELLAVVRAHITSLGGNAMVSFYMTELILVDNQHKNQGQCLISIGGDAVYVSYYPDD